MEHPPETPTSPARQAAVIPDSPQKVSSQADASNENVCSPSAEKSDTVKITDSVVTAGDDDSDKVNGGNPTEEEKKVAGSGSVPCVSSHASNEAEGEEKNQKSNEELAENPKVETTCSEGPTTANREASVESAQLENCAVPPKGNGKSSSGQRETKELAEDQKGDEKKPLTDEPGTIKGVSVPQSAEKLEKSPASPKQEKGPEQVEVEAEIQELADKKKDTSSPVSESTQTPQQPKTKASATLPVVKVLSTQPTATITAKIIAKGHSAHSNQEVVVAKTPGGQMYLIQGNVLVPVENITVQQDKGRQGPKVIVVNPSRTAPPVVFTNLVTQSSTASKSKGAKESVARNSQGDDIKVAVVREGSSTQAQKSKASKKSHKGDLSARKESSHPGTQKSTPSHEISSRTSTGIEHRKISSPTVSRGEVAQKGKERMDDNTTEISEEDRYASGTKDSNAFTKRRMGRPLGSKDKQKRKPYILKSKVSEIQKAKPAQTRFLKTANAVKETKSPGSESSGKKRPLDVPTISKSSHASKKHRLGTSHVTIKHISVMPRGGVDGELWVCSLCGKAVNENLLGTLYGPYKARLSRERRDSTSKDSKPPNLTSPVRPSSSCMEVPLEDEKNEVDLWVHKDCAVWSHGVFMLGRTLHGLEQAVESAALHVSRNLLLFLLAID